MPTANPGLDLTYFFTKNIAATTVIAVPLAKVDLKTGSTTTNATDQWALPLSLIGQYHFLSDGVDLALSRRWADLFQILGRKEPPRQPRRSGRHLGRGRQRRRQHQDSPSNWVAAIDLKKWWLAPGNVHIGGNRANNVSLGPWFFGAGIGYAFSTPALF